MIGEATVALVLHGGSFLSSPFFFSLQWSDCVREWCHVPARLLLRFATREVHCGTVRVKCLNCDVRTVADRHKRGCCLA